MIGEVGLVAGGQSRDTAGKGSTSSDRDPVPASSRTSPTWRELIDFAETMPEGPRARARVIRQTFRWSTGRFWWELHRAIDRPEAMRYAPQTVAALQRAREQGRLRRSLSGDAA